MDLRSAADRERFPQYPQAGRDLAHISCGFLWCILFSIAGWAPDRPPFGRMGAGFPKSGGNPGSAPGSRTQNQRTHPGTIAYRPLEGQRRKPPQAVAVQLENRQKFQAAFSRGFGCPWLLSRCGRKWSLRAGIPHPVRIEPWFWFFKGTQNFMRIDAIILRELHIPLVRPFETSFGVTRNRRIVIAEVQSEGLTGWGECTAGERPYFSGESTDTAWQVLVKSSRPCSLPSLPNTAVIARAFSRRCVAIPWPRPRWRTRSGILKRSAKAFRSPSSSAACAKRFLAESRSAFNPPFPSSFNHREGTGRRISAHQAQVQTGLGR